MLRASAKRLDRVTFGGQNFTGILGEERHSLGLCAVARVVLQKLAVLFHHDAAAARSHDDRLDALLDVGPPGVDIATHELEPLVLSVEMIGDSAAAARFARRDE